MQSVSVKKIQQKIEGSLRFPGDKSLSHRAIIFGSLAQGVSTFTNVLAGEDCVCTRRAFEAMGISIRSSDPTRLEIEGKGLHGLASPKRELYLGNSGTSMRLLMGLLAAQPFKSMLTGDPSLSRRPMKRVADPLRQMGAKIDGRDNGNYAPITVEGASLNGIDYRLPVSSAQVKSALLLAGLFACGTTKLTEPIRSRDHTEKFLAHFGARVRVDDLTIAMQPAEQLKPASFEIAGDISSAAFFMGLAALLKSRAALEFKSVLWNPTRTGIVKVLKDMGLTFEIQSERKLGPETVADFRIKAGNLKAFEIKKERLPSLIDEIPLLSVLATQAEGTTVIHEAGELRVKETDRIDSMVENLSKMGAKIRAQENTIVIKGPTVLKGATVKSFADHRTAMSLIVAALAADGQTLIEDTECIATSFPTFFDLLSHVGVDFELLTP